nr:MAG TPA: hypothetical protein [Caudoviricetes sp.]
MRCLGSNLIFAAINFIIYNSSSEIEKNSLG